LERALLERALLEWALSERPTQRHRWALCRLLLQAPVHQCLAIAV